MFFRFAGDPASSATNSLTAPAEENPSVIEQIKLGVASVAKSFSIDMWLARHTPEKVLPLLRKALTGIKEEFADAVAHGGGVHAVGYCFGAKYVLLLAANAATAQSAEENDAAKQTPSEEQIEEGHARSAPEISVAAIAHGTQVTVSDLENCAVPLSIVAVEEDSLFPDEVREAGVKALQEKGVDVEVEVFPGVPHGFAVLGEYDDAKIQEKQGKAFEQLLGWLKGH
jgi:dienelactone hydrolase